MLLEGIKIFLTAVIISVIAWVSKRHSLIGALIASLPLTSVLAFIWIYIESGDVVKISKMSTNIIWLVLPSLLFFFLLPIFINKYSLKFPAAICLSMLCCSVGYAVLYQILKVSNK